jgi:serine/threonine protein kinase
MKEVELMRNIQHNNIIKMKGCFQSACNDYMVLEYLKGGTLTNYMKINNVSVPLSH